MPVDYNKAKSVYVDCLSKSSEGFGRIDRAMLAMCKYVYEEAVNEFKPLVWMHPRTGLLYAEEFEGGVPLCIHPLYKPPFSEFISSDQLVSNGCSPTVYTGKPGEQPETAVPRGSSMGGGAYRRRPHIPEEINSGGVDDLD